MRTSILMILCVLFVVGACSDENTPPQGKDLTVADQKPIEIKDGDVDAPQDSAPDLALILDADTDSAQDLAQGDLTQDMSGPDGPPPIVSGEISRTIAPIFDGRGTIYVGIGDALFNPPTKVHNVDLSQPNSTVKYAVYNVPPGDHEIWAFLDDNSNAGIFPFADPGDLVTSAVIPITVGSTPIVQNLVLSQVYGVAADAGVGEAGVVLGSLRGKISRSIAPTLDAGGTLYITLYKDLPPDSQRSGTSIASVDLASPYASETYFLGNIEPGQYYLEVFLDDNNNAFFFTPVPDKDDLTHAQPIQVHVVEGVVNVQDVVLDKVVP